jgi:hypothetical protein
MLTAIVCAGCEHPLGRVVNTKDGPMLTGVQTCPQHGTPAVSLGTLSAYAAAALADGQPRRLAAECH